MNVAGVIIVLFCILSMAFIWRYIVKAIYLPRNDTEKYSPSQRGYGDLVIRHSMNFSSQYRKLNEVFKDTLYENIASVELIPFLVVFYKYILLGAIQSGYITYKEYENSTAGVGYAVKLTHKNLLSDTHQQSLSLYQKLIDGMPARCDWWVGADKEPLRNDILLNYSAGFADILMNPELIHNYENGPFCLHGITEVMTFTDLFTNKFVPTVMECGNAIHNTIKYGK